MGRSGSAVCPGFTWPCDSPGAHGAVLTLTVFDQAPLMTPFTGARLEDRRTHSVRSAL